MSGGAEARTASSSAGAAHAAAHAASLVHIHHRVRLAAPTAAAARRNAKVIVEIILHGGTQGVPLLVLVGKRRVDESGDAGQRALLEQAQRAAGSLVYGGGDGGRPLRRAAARAVAAAPAAAASPSASPSSSSSRPSSRPLLPLRLLPPLLPLRPLPAPFSAAVAPAVSGGENAKQRGEKGEGSPIGPMRQLLARVADATHELLGELAEDGIGGACRR